MDDYSWAETLTSIMAGRDIARDDAAAAMAEIMNGRATDSQIAAFIVGLRTKGESAA